MDTRQRRGRPPKPPLERREERLDLRVSQTEKEAFRLAADKSQLDLSVWIRIQLSKAIEDGTTTEDVAQIIAKDGVGNEQNA